MSNELVLGNNNMTVTINVGFMDSLKMLLSSEYRFSIENEIIIPLKSFIKSAISMKFDGNCKMVQLVEINPYYADEKFSILTIYCIEV
jgi:hypothetical protein